MKKRWFNTLTKKEQKILINNIKRRKELIVKMKAEGYSDDEIEAELWRIDQNGQEGS